MSNDTPRAHVLAMLLSGMLTMFGCTPAPTLAPVGATQTEPVSVAQTVAQPAIPAGSASVLDTPADLPLQEAPPLPALKSAVETLHILGNVTLPRTVGGLANAHDGVVAGAPITVFDAFTGRRVGSGVTYYDGSYDAEVPSKLGKRPLLLHIQLVDDTTQMDVFPLVTAVELAPELGEQHADISPATTAWVALLYNLAARDDHAPAPDWTKVVPGDVTHKLAAMIAGTQDSAQTAFISLADVNGDLAHSTTAEQLRATIDGLVDRLVTGAKAPKPR